MKGKGISSPTARTVVEAQRDGRDHRILGDDYEIVGQGNELEERVVDDVVRQLTSLKETLERNNKALDVNSFDCQASVTVHRDLRLGPELAVEQSFWRWLAVEKLHGIVEARSGRSGSASWASYGVEGSVESNRIAILWFRSHMVFDPDGNDPYAFARQPAHTDFWESGIIRHRYGWSRNLARCLVRFQYRDRDSDAAYLHSTNPNGIRALYKKLRRLHSTMAFEFLADEEVWQVLEEQSVGLTRA